MDAPEQAPPVQGFAVIFEASAEVTRPAGSATEETDR